MAVSTHLQIDLAEYDARIRTFIPRYEEMLEAGVSALVDAGARPATVVDLGIGTGALASRVAARYRRAHLVGIDEDAGMLDMAARRLPAKRTTLVHDSFTRADVPRCDVVTASFALHHVRQRRAKAALYRRLRLALRTGGVLVSADCHPPAHPGLARAAHDAWQRHLEEAYSPAESRRFLRAWSHEDFYMPLDTELALLVGAGFAPEVTWRRDGFAVILAATSSAPGRPRRR